MTTERGSKMNVLKNKKIGFAVLIVAAGAAAFVLFGRGGSSIEVKTMAAVKGDITRTVSMSGTLEPVSTETITVSQGLKVMKVYINENDKVEAGQIIAELDSTELRLSLEKTAIALEQVEDDMGTLKNSSISNDQALLKNSLNRAKEDYNKAVADAAKGAEDLAAFKVLFDQGAISKSEFDNRVSSQRTLEALRNTTLLNYEDATIRYSQYLNTSSDGIQGLDRQRRSILLDMELLQNSLNDTMIKASIGGVVVDLPLDEGKEVPQGAVVTIHGEEGTQLVSYITQEESLLVSEGQKASIVIPGSTNTYEGTVIFVGGQAKIETNGGSRTPKVEIRIKLSNPDDKSVPGFDADAVVSTDFAEQVLTIKTEAVRYDDEGSAFVFKINGGNVEKTPVELGISDGYTVEIISGLNENDKLVLNPSRDIEDGTSITIVE